MKMKIALQFVLLVSLMAATNAQVASKMGSVQLLLAGERFEMSLGDRQLLNDGRELNLSFFPDQTTVVLTNEP